MSEGIDAYEGERATLFKLSVNPLAIKPSQVTPPDQDGPQTTYEYVLPGIGNAIQQRWTPKRWEILLVGQNAPESFAPRESARRLDRVGEYQWWRITGGPFAGGFIFRSGGGIEVRSKEDVCGKTPPEHDPIPMVSAECR